MLYKRGGLDGFGNDTQVMDVRLMDNTLLTEIEYKTEETRWGTWRRHFTTTGTYFAEFRSHATFLGLPLLHYTRGKCPETGRRIVAKGVVAVGRLALGIVAIGHASLGLVAVGQLAIGLLFGLGQACTGLGAVGQVALGLSFGLGQLATGHTAIGQLAVGEYVLAQAGIGDHVWSSKQADPEAVEYFQQLWDTVRKVVSLK